MENKKILPILAIGIIFILAIVVGGTFWLQNQKKIDSGRIPATFKFIDKTSKCDDLAFEIREMINNTKSCSQDSDCVYADSIAEGGCFTGCGLVINNNYKNSVELNQIKNKISNYNNKKCPRCVLDCAENINTLLKCKNSKCTIEEVK